MLADEIRKARHEGKAVVNEIAPCAFCGQNLNISALPEWNKSKLKEMATQSCRCESAVNHTSRIQSIERLDATIKMLFGKDSGRCVDEDTAKIIRELAVEVLDRRIDEASVKIPETQFCPQEKLTIKIKDSQLLLKMEHKETAAMQI